MADAAPAGDEKKKVVVKSAKGTAAEGAVDNKKKFEVKKVGMLLQFMIAVTDLR